jgi:hypothetical protein
LSSSRILVVILLPAIAACGGGSSGGTPTSPSSTPPPAASAPPAPPAPAPTPPSNFGPYTFVFDAGTSASDQALIAEATRLAHDFFQATFGRTIERATEIRGLLSAQGCGAGGGGAAAFTGSGFVTFCLGNPGWTQPRPITRRKIVVHEVYHALQFERRWLGNAQQNSGALWVIEGAAEVVAYRGIDSAGLLSYDTARGCQVREFTDFAMREPPGLPNLSELESNQAWGQTRGPSYTVAMTGMDQLLSTRSLAALNSYMDAIAGGTAWPAAFQNAFGQSTTAFYAQWPGYRSSLAVPPSYLCGV